tara:strand:+ start:690 stop:1061 length:372 start_codon:yes stop_codon:yes gene_type:complete
MAGLLYTPRLFVYHCENISNDKISNIFKIMEHRLFYFIATPSAIAVWITGIYLLYILGPFPWLIAKIIFVIIMSVYHIIIRKYLLELKNGNCKKSSKFFRLINEIPFIILFLILILVIIKPDF